MANYAPSTRARLGDIKNGMLVQTAKEVSYLDWGVTVQAYIFRVYNRIMVHGLWLEVGATALVGAGSLPLFNYRQTTPAVGVAAISTVGATIHAYATGSRVTLGGVSVATAVNVDSAPGYSFVPAAPVMLGHAPSGTVDPQIGEIGFLNSIAVLTAGTGQFSILYTPVDPGAYVTALL